jgi:hypothetical protein
MQQSIEAKGFMPRGRSNVTFSIFEGKYLFSDYWEDKRTMFSLPARVDADTKQVVFDQPPSYDDGTLDIEEAVERIVSYAERADYNDLYEFTVDKYRILQRSRYNNAHNK